MYAVTCIVSTLTRDYIHKHLRCMVNFVGGRISTFSNKLSMSEAAIVHRVASFNVSDI